MLFPKISKDIEKEKLKCSPPGIIRRCKGGHDMISGKNCYSNVRNEIDEVIFHLRKPYFMPVLALQRHDYKWWPNYEQSFSYNPRPHHPASKHNCISICCLQSLLVTSQSQ